MDQYLITKLTKGAESDNTNSILYNTIIIA